MCNRKNAKARMQRPQRFSLYVIHLCGKLCALVVHKFWFSFITLLASCIGITCATAQQTVGLFLNDTTSFNGYTLFAPLGSVYTYLIDNCGQEVHRWVSHYRPGQSIYLLENGDLLRTARIPNASFNGGGSGGRIERFDWDGNLHWEYEYSSPSFHQHHDIEPLPNGNILVLAWEARSRAEAISKGIDASLIDQRVWSEQVVELQVVGVDSAIIVWQWSLWDHLIQDVDSSKEDFGSISEHPERVDLNFWQGQGADRFHANSIAYNPERDEVLISVRNYNEIWVIDHSTTGTEAAGTSGGNSGRGGDLLYRWGNPQVYARGTNTDQKFFAQHDAQWIPQDYSDGGKILLYNNGDNRPQGDFSTVEIIDPPLDSANKYIVSDSTPFGPESQEWKYLAPDTFSFFSRAISGAQRLSNGNTLICEGGSGHFFEVDKNHLIVWDYINPIQPGGPIAQGITPGVNNVFKIRRYGPDYPAFDGKALSPEGPLELNPLPTNCTIFYDSTVSIAEDFFRDLQIYPNPVEDVLSFSLESETSLQISIYNVLAMKVFTRSYTDADIEIDVSEWEAGVYVVKIVYSESGLMGTYKILKQ